MTRLLLVLFSVLSFSQCDTIAKNNDDKCKEYNKKSTELINSFYMNEDSLYLDSALFYIEKGLEKCEEYESLFSLRKLSVLSLQQNYSEGLLFVKTFDEEMFSDLPYFKNLLLNRFKAMNSLSKGDTVERNSYLNYIIKDLKDFLNSHKKEIDSIYKLDNAQEILNSPYSTSIIQFYYYRSILEGDESIKKELNVLKDKESVNNDFLEVILTTLEHDFMVFMGI